MTAKTALVLRCCASDMTSHHGFIWPGVGEEAVATDWRANGRCGNGLHGWLNGQGDHSCTDYSTDPDAKWLVVEVDAASIIDLADKVKFPRGVVRFVGGRAEAAAYLIAHSPDATAVIGAVLTVGDRVAAVVGDLGTATAGYLGTATAGNSGTATAGEHGTATAGDHGTATAGDLGTATAGDGGTATAGYRGTLCIRWFDNKATRYRMSVGHVGEGGIEPNVAYQLNAGHFVKADLA